MGAEEALKAGDPDLALTELTERVKRSPADARLRIFLFQLLAVLGQWQRALTQLNVAGELDAGALAMVSTYRDALSCEALRAHVFSGERDPLVLGEPADWVAAPRWHHQYLPDRIIFEPNAFTASEQEALRAKGHRLEATDDTYGNMQLILWDRAAQRVQAASDPRGIGEAKVLADPSSAPSLETVQDLRKPPQSPRQTP
jgi:protein involved in temperature-dependent protein secretion